MRVLRRGKIRTAHDVTGGNRSVYHIDRTIRETGSLFGDGSHILYVNGTWRDESPVGRLMHDLSRTEPDKMNYTLLADRVRYFKEDKKGAQTMSKIYAHLTPKSEKTCNITA